MRRILLALALMGAIAPAQASALSVPEANITCGGTYNSFYMTGGSSYTVYESVSANAQPTWDVNDQITWNTETATPVHNGTGQVAFLIGRDAGKFYKYRVVSGAETVTIRCPFWRSASIPLSDSTAAAYVAQTAERIAGNATANAYYNASEVTTYQATNAGDHYLDNVTGNYVDPAGTPTTSEILQWGAAKWGIPLVILKAMAERESSWVQAAMGDREDGVDASQYPVQSRIDSDSVYESLGLMQIKWQPDGSPNPGTEPLRWKSTAFNVDYTGARLRYFFDGFGPGTGGEERNSIGAHFTGGSSGNWGDASSDTYSQNNLNTVGAKPWGSF